MKTTKDATPDFNTLNPEDPDWNMGVTFERFSRGILGDNSEYTDTLDALFDAQTIQDYINMELPALVAKAREEGASWEAIAERLGVTRQSAWERFS